MIEEQWLPVPGYEGLYEVSDQGRVRSLPRAATRGQVLTPTPNDHGYMRVTLCREGQQKVERVHRIVTLVFHGPRPVGMEVRHIDGDQSNNAAANLAYGTARENAADQLRHGTHANARKTHCPSGHSYSDPDNLIEYRGARQCRQCQMTNRARRARRGSVRISCPDCGSQIRTDGLAGHRQNYCKAVA